MNMRDVVGSAFWILVGLFFCIKSIAYGFLYEGAPGPGFLPLLGGVTLIFLGLIVFVTALKKAGSEKHLQDKFFPENFSFKKIILTVLALIVYIAVLEYVGFLLTTFFFMLFLFRAIEPKKWALAIAFSVLIASFSYILFQLLLKVQLPRGIWGI
jgi:putative tricarboxylic transport membrane protein